MDKLILEYKKLEYQEKRVLELKCLAKEGLSRTNFTILMNNSDLKLYKGSSYKIADLDILTTRLKERKLLNNNLECVHSIRPFLMKKIFHGEDSPGNKAFLKSMGSLDSFNDTIIAIWLNDKDVFNKFLLNTSFKKENPDLYFNQIKIFNRLKHALSNITLERDFLEDFTPLIQIYVVVSKLTSFLQGSTIKHQDIKIISDIISKNFKSWKIESSYMVEIFTTFFILSGEIEHITHLRKALETVSALNYLQVYGIELFLNGNNSEAIVCFEQAKEVIKKDYKRRNNTLSGVYGIFHILSLLQTNDNKKLNEIESIAINFGKSKKQYDTALRSLSPYNTTISNILLCYYPKNEIIYNYFILLIRFIKTGEMESGDFRYLISYPKPEAVLDLAILRLGSEWVEMQSVWENSSNKLDQLSKGHLDILKGVKEILVDVNNKENINELEQNIVEQKTYKINFLDIVKIKPIWERSLDNLSQLFNREETDEEEEKQLAWNIYLDGINVKKIEARERVIRGNSGGNGKIIATQRLSQEWHEMNYVTKQDIEVINAIKEEKDYDYGYPRHYFDKNLALKALIGHPLIVNGDTRNAIEMIEGKPELIVEEKGSNYIIKLTDSSDVARVQLRKESSTTYKVVEITMEIAKISQVLKDGIKIPKEHKDRVLGLLLKAAPSIGVRAEFDDDSIESEAVDSKLIVQLYPFNSGLAVKLIVRPFKDGMAYTPGKGAKSVITIADGQHKKMVRKLSQEKMEAQELLKKCNKLDATNKKYDWEFEELGDALEVLYDVENYKKDTENEEGNKSIEIEWPKGEAFSIKKSIDFKDVSMSVRGKNDWFEFDGQVKLEEDEVIKMAEFLKMSEGAEGRFIKLDDNKFIALTKSLLKRVRELNVISNNGSVHKLGSSIISDFEKNSAEITTDHIWKQNLKQIKASERDIKLPKDLKAELRDYQMEGFKWLSKLSNMGLGGCLADDMGLGKTVQTLGLLLNETKSGPCLVIAPASVCNVWHEECQKFAPSLKCISIPDTDKEECIKKIKAKEVLIVSYGMIYQIEEALIKKKWHLIVLDEAQAIKNYNTKRFKIITKLESKKRVALSGTPVENHIEELWNLFEFLNPGFLGSRKEFQVKYAKAIEIDKNLIVRDALKRLIKPFILRRLKDKVLTELPTKTEQTILIDPSNEEKSFYEALRRKAIERINNIDEVDAAKKRFSVLAEITKLRRACCDSSLADPEVHLNNSKLEALDGILKDIISNNHRALIFSQYVGYLKIVKERIIKKNIKYQYLDGSTTQKKRKEGVAAFQKGEGDVFLISLKAGGAGLNLTSADYVVHLDPWWNPAVEDQASDRIYRMGQTRPVAIYRLVMKHSIEEKIIGMHKNKRELAIGLLSGADKNISLTEKELLSLLLE